MAKRLSGPPASDPFSVGRLFEENYPLVIPRWQRDYAWAPDEQVKYLLEDLNEFFSDARLEKNRYYLLGQVIFVSNDNFELEIVDGQQRLTTLFLIISALHNALRKDLNREIMGDLNIVSSLNKCIFDENSRVKLQSPYQDGTTVITKLVDKGVEATQFGSLSTSQSNLKKVYEYVDEWIKNELGEKETIQEFTRILLNQVWLTRLAIEDIPVALDYFEKMNRRGLPLAASDLLKNYLFSKVSEIEYPEMTNQWRAMQKELDKVSRRSVGNTETFVKAWATAESGVKLNGAEPLLKYWKTQLETPAQIMEFRNRLRPMGEIFQRIANFKHITDESIPIVEAGKHFNGSQFIAVLMAGRDLVNFDYLADLVDRRFIAYVYAKERTASFESVIASWAKKIAALDKNSSWDEILEASRSSSESFVMPIVKEQIESGIRELSYSRSTHAKKLRYVLARSSQHLDIQAKNGDYAKSLSEYLTTVKAGKPGIDMDHIYGQKYFEDADEITARIFNSIGALTPVFSSDHREETKLLPHEKANMYRKSRYLLTHSLVEIDGKESPRIKKALEDIIKFSRQI